MSKDIDENLFQPMPQKSDVPKVKVCMYITDIGKKDLEEIRAEYPKKSIGDIYEWVLRVWMAQQEEIKKGKTITFRNK